MGLHDRDVSSVLSAIDSSTRKKTHDSTPMEDDPHGPALPDWTQRPYLTMSYLTTAKPVVRERETRSLGSLPSKVQELVIVEELLNALMGFEGKYISVTSKQRSDVEDTTPQMGFTLRQTVDSSISSLSERILPVADRYVRVVDYADFGSRYEQGLVSHAFCAALKVLIKEYLVFVNQLDHLFRTKELSLQKLWFQIQPTAKTMEILDRLVANARELNGGALLNHIHDKSVSMGGDRQAQNLFKFILERATVPYFEMLQSWIYRGDLSDLYSEFLVEGNSNFNKQQLASDFPTGDNYWSERYTLRENIPVFLERYQNKILVTGKYLNVVRECGRDVRFNGGAISLGVNYGEWIDKAHEYACIQVLQLIMEEHKLINRLKSIKHYYLLDRGDFLVHFLDSADLELEKQSLSVPQDKLKSLLEMAVKTSSVNDDPYQNDVTCTMSDQKLVDYLNNLRGSNEGRPTISAMTAREAFSLQYKVTYPISLVVNKKHLVKYDLIFRHLFNCKCIERSLCSAWLRHKFTKELDLGMSLQSLYALRSRMLHFVQNFTYYMMVEVIDKNHHLMIEKMRSAKTLEDIMKAHEDFLDTCLASCLISNQKAFTTLSKLLTTCGVFAQYMNQFTSTLTVDDMMSSDHDDVFEHRRQRIRLLSQNAQKSVDENFVGNIEKFEKNFSNYFVQLMESMKKTSQTAGGVNFEYLFSAFVNTIVKM